MSKTAVITGATSGIGAEYARRLAADGYDLIITGRRQEIIEKLADDLRKNHNVNVNVVIAELSDDNDIQKVIDAINAVDDIEMLVNNAGYASEMKHCMEFELADHEKLIKVHQIAPLRLIYAAVPKMIKKGKGNIVNVSSLGVYTPSPMTYSYTATKSYLKQFTEGLYQELKDNGIKVQVLCPAFTKTDFYRNIPEDEREKVFDKAKMFTVSTEATVKYSLKGLEKNKALCLPGAMMGFLALLFQSIPRLMLYKISGKMIET